MTTTDDFSSTTSGGTGSTATREAGHRIQPRGIMEAGPECLRSAVEKSVGNYLSGAGKDSDITNLYQLVLSEVEGPLLEAVLHHTSSNQSKASIMLGLNRGTLRKKLKQHGLL